MGELIIEQNSQCAEELTRLKDIMASGKKADATEEKEGGKPSERAQSGLYLVKPQNGPRSVIGVIDDDEAIIFYLKEYLTRKGYAVVSFLSSEEALKFFEEKLVKNSRIPSEERPFSLVLADLRMPRLSGLDLMKKVLQYFPRMPVVLMTAYASVPDAVDAMRHGVLDYLEKPLSLGKLDEILIRVVSVPTA